jgi:hypothetical protein
MREGRTEFMRRYATRTVLSSSPAAERLAKFTRRYATEIKALSTRSFPPGFPSWLTVYCNNPATPQL